MISDLTSYLEIISLNGLLSLQDLGRAQSQHLGFSVGGCADEYAFLFANYLVSQQDKNTSAKQRLNIATLELTMGQASFCINQACHIAITGADCSANINGKALANWRCHYLSAGDILTFSQPSSGLHSYIAIAGGFKLHPKQQPWLTSYAQTSTEAALTFSANKLQAKDKLYFDSEQQAFDAQTNQQLMPSTASAHFYSQQAITLRFLPSKLFQQLSLQQQQNFLNQDYYIAAQSNRMGYRLNTKSGCKRDDIVPETSRCQHTLSRPVSFGTIQLPQDQHPIVLMKERQTMGGYPVLGSVIQTDLFRLSQMRPGEQVNFIATNYQFAQQQLKLFYQRF